MRRVASSLAQPWPASETSSASTSPPRQLAQRRTSTPCALSVAGPLQPALSVNSARLLSTGRGARPSSLMKIGLAKPMVPSILPCRAMTSGAVMSSEHSDSSEPLTTTATATLPGRRQT